MSMYSYDEYSLIDEQQDMSKLATLIPPLTPDSSSVSMASNANTPPPSHSFNPVVGKPWATTTADRLPPSPLNSTVSTHENRDLAIGLQNSKWGPRPEPKSKPIHADLATETSPVTQNTQPRNSPWNAIPNKIISNTGIIAADLPNTGSEAVFPPLWDRFQDLRLLNREKHAFNEVCKVLVNESRLIKPEREQDLLSRLEDRNWQLQRYRQQERDFRNREASLAARLAELESSKERDGYVMVLVDASTQPFNEELLFRGEDGGRQAAEILQTTIATAVEGGPRKTISPEKVIIRVYADQELFAENLPAKDFVRGFNAAGNRTDFVDGKRFRQKFEENCVLALDDQHCAQLFIGGMGDTDGGSSLVKQLDNIAGSANRTTLLIAAEEMVPHTWRKYLGREISYLFSKPKPSVQQAPNPPPPSPKKSSAPVPKTWASTAAKAATLIDTTNQAPKAKPTPAPPIKKDATSSHSPATSTTGSAMASNNPRILLNSRGQRIDPLVPHDKEEVARLKKLKLCNAHFLRRFCYSGKDCYHDHTYKISPSELKTLEHVARMAPCGQGSDCDDENCYHGHVCPAPKGRKGESCIFGDTCRFPEDMHNVERK